MRQKSLFLRLAIVWGVTSVAGAIALSVGWAASGSRQSLAAGGLAWGVCTLAATIALVAGEPLRKPQHVIASVVLGMTVRMGIPLAAAIFFRQGPLADAGVLYYLILFYTLTLITETLLSLPEKKNTSSRQEFVG